jgi:hypothetical protein
MKALLGIFVGLVVFIVSFASLFLFGPPVWFIIFPIVIGIAAGRWVGSR